MKINYSSLYKLLMRAYSKEEQTHGTGTPWILREHCFNDFWIKIYILKSNRSSRISYRDIQGSKEWFAKCDKHYPSRFRQTSLATAVTNFTKPCTSHFFGLCTDHVLQTFISGPVVQGSAYPQDPGSENNRIKGCGRHLQQAEEHNFLT